MAGALWQAGLFALACNLDTLLLSLLHAARGCRVGLRAGAGITLATTAVTGAFLLLGQAGRVLIPLDRLGAAALMGLGLWSLVRSPGAVEEPEDGLWPQVRLGVLLALNNAGAGLAMGAAGLDPLLGAAANLGATVLCLALGQRLCRHRELCRWAGPLSGVMLLLLGLWELL